MPFGSAGTLFMDILPRTTAFIPALSTQVNSSIGKVETGVKGAVQRITSQVTGLGTSLGTTLGLGFAVAGVAAGKMALDFENAFTKINALSNTSSATVSKWKEQVLQLSGATTVAPQELADALFFLASAGLKANQVMPALAVSARAAAAGMGTTVDVANLVASAMNAYAKSGLTAAEVTDTLTAAIKIGRAEPEDFADALGRLFPIAVQAGVGFDNLTASIAQLTNAGIDVPEAVTAIRGALQAIAAPGTQAGQTLEQIGLSAQDLLDAISHGGILEAFRLLDEAVRRSTDTRAEFLETFRQIIPNIRGETGVLALLNVPLKQANDNFEQVTNAVGEGNSAFQTFLAGPGASFARLFNQMRIAAIRFGEAILPVARAVADVLAPAIAVVADHASQLLIVFLGWKALSFLPGLLLSVAGGLEAVGAASTATGVLGVASALEKLKLAAGALATIIPALALFGGASMSTINSFKDVDESIKTWGNELIAGGQHLRDFITVFETANPSIHLNAEAVQLAARSHMAYADALAQVQAKTEGAVTAEDKLTQAHQEATQAAYDQIAAELSLAGDLTGILGSLQSAAQAQDTLAEAQAKVDRLRAAGRQGTQAYRTAVEALRAAQLGALNSQLQIANAVQTYVKAINEGTVTQRQAIQQLRTFGAQAGLTKGQINDMIQQVRTATNEYTKLAGAPDIHKKVTVDTKQAQADLRTLQGQLQGLPAQKVISVIFRREGAGAIFGATGFHGQVSQPTLFVAGERGTEQVDITPNGKQRLSTGGSGQIAGTLAIADWHRGLAVLQGELDWQDAARN